jgi:parallel beta-helix repeat protein
VKGNRTSANLTGIDAAGDNNTLNGNRSEGNSGNGIEIDGNANSFKANVANGNDANGIFVGSGAGNFFKKNSANSNGYVLTVSDGVGLGINTLNDATASGKKNRARGNDDPDECEGISCI